MTLKQFRFRIRHNQSRFLLHRRFFVYGILVVGFLIISLVAAPFLPEAPDWSGVFRPAASAVLQGKSPFSEEMFFSAPWSIMPYLPFALLPSQIARSFMFFGMIIAYAWSAQRLGAKPLVMMAFLVSPPVVFSLWLSSLDWMPLVGFVLPPQIGLFFIAAKPQMSSVVGVFWLIESWRNGGPREIVRVFAPFTIVLFASFIIFGFWPLRATWLPAIEHNASLWPASIPIGLVLAVSALKHRNINPAMAASPLLTPYIMFPSYLGALASILQHSWETIGAVVGLWILVLMRALG